MSFNWNLYVDVANELIEHQRTRGLEDAYLRSSISRSYYGVFGNAKNKLVEKGERIPLKDTHKFVRITYVRSTIKTERKIGEELKRLLNERKKADYDKDETFDNERAKTAHRIASETIGLIEGL